MTSVRRVAILGAGPIGIEAALCARELGHEVIVFEQGRVAEHVLRWGHVTFFSPWELNCSARGERLRAQMELPPLDATAFPTGEEYVRDYLEPLSRHPLLEGAVHTRCEVLAVTRANALKGDFVGDRASREATPFLIRVRDEQGVERYHEADVVLDTTGSYGNPASLGPGGMSAIGEAALADRIDYYTPDMARVFENDYEGKRVLLVGSGYSAATTLEGFRRQVEQESRQVEVLWAWRGEAEEAPYELIPHDVLPQRASLAMFANRVASGEVEWVKPLPTMQVWRLDEVARGEGQGVRVTLKDFSTGATQEIEVDRVIANVGYRPDTELYRELQVHLCYASEGPMKLAASLLAAGGGGGDCLAQESAGPEVLQTPEPDFYVLGAKSYGRGSAFLIRLGLEQVEQVFGMIG